MNQPHKLKVDIINRQKTLPVPRKLIRRAIGAAYEGLTATGEVEVVVVEDEEMAALNEEFLSHSGPTDVLAFHYPEEAVQDEIIVNADYAVRESEKRGHPAESELVLYVVHGALHVNGYDDQDPKSRRLMQQRQLEIAKSIGLSLADFSAPSTDSGG